MGISARSRIGVAGLATVAIALLVAGCTGGSAPPKPKGSPGNDINPVSYSHVHTGGTLRYPIADPIANFNRYTPDGANAGTEAVAAATLPSLFTIDGKNAFVHDPDYLTGEPTVAAAPAQTITYNLNPKATWSDGTPISYRDFAAQWQALRGTNPSFAIVAPADYTDIASVARGASDQQVVVTMKPGIADGDWRGLFSPLYPASAMSTATAFNTGWKSAAPISAGPFMYAASSAPTSNVSPSSGVPANGSVSGDAAPSAGEQTYTLVRNPHWWGRTAKLDSIDFTVEATPAVAAAALAAGRIDVLDVGTDAATYAHVAQLPGVAIHRASGPDIRDITLNGSRAPLNDLALRRAIAMGIDRNAIAKNELAPLGITTAAAPGSNIFPSGQVGYKDNAGALGTYNPTAAGTALTADGWIDNPTTGTRTKNGQTLTITFVVPSKTPANLSDAQLVAQQLARVDVKVAIKQVPAQSFFSGYIAPGSFDMTVFSWLGGNFPITDASVIYQPQAPGGDWARNYSRVSVPELSTLFRQATSDLDAASADAAANQADVLIWQNVMTLPLYRTPQVWATRAKLANFGAFGYATPDWTAIGFTG